MMKSSLACTVAAIALLGLTSCATLERAFGRDSGSGADRVPRLRPKPYRIGIAPSHIVQSPNELFAANSEWDEVRSKVQFYKYYGTQLADTEGTTDLDPEALVAFAKRHHIGIGCEFGSFHPGQGTTMADASEMAFQQIDPVFRAGGEVSSLHLDGPIRRMLRGVQTHPMALTLDEIAESLADFWRRMHDRYPRMQIGLITNFPNWDYTDKLIGYVGSYTDLSGWTYREALEAVHNKIIEQGERIDFIEVDLPYNFYTQTATMKGGIQLENRRKLLALQEWCEDHGVRFHMIVNTMPHGRATHFHDMTLEYLRRLRQDGVFPDVFIIQSWYKIPEEFLPETWRTTFMGTARNAIRLIQDLYPSTRTGPAPAPNDAVCASTTGGIQVIRPDGSHFSWHPSFDDVEALQTAHTRDGNHYWFLGETAAGDRTISLYDQLADTTQTFTLGHSSPGFDLVDADASLEGTLQVVVQNSLDGSYVIQDFDPVTQRTTDMTDPIVGSGLAASGFGDGPLVAVAGTRPEATRPELRIFDSSTGRELAMVRGLGDSPLIDMDARQSAPDDPIELFMLRFAFSADLVQRVLLDPVSFELLETHDLGALPEGTLGLSVTGLPGGGAIVSARDAMSGAGGVYGFDGDCAGCDADPIATGFAKLAGCDVEPGASFPPSPPEPVVQCEPVIVKLADPEDVELLHSSQDGVEHSGAIRVGYARVAFELEGGGLVGCPPDFLQDRSVEVRVFAADDSGAGDPREAASTTRPGTPGAGQTRWAKLRLVAEPAWCSGRVGAEEIFAPLSYELTQTSETLDDRPPNASYRGPIGTILCPPSQATAPGGE